jgi:2-oxo-hept-3-ene-1,7-dioate hydratase
VSVDDEIAAGMRAQLGRRDAELMAGAQPLGWKLGLTVPAVQEALGLEGPVAGFLTSGTRVDAGAEVSLAGFTAGFAEPEVAIHVGEGGAVAGLGAAIELVDIDLPFEVLEAILVGNVFHRAVAIGPMHEGATLDGVTARVTRSGEPTGEAVPAEVVGDPAEVVRFVAGYLEPHGARLEPGHVIIAGSLTAPVPVSPGDRFEVDLGPLGALALNFAG